MSLSDVQSLLAAELARGPKVLSVQVSQETFSELPVNPEGRPLPLTVGDSLIQVKGAAHNRADWVDLIGWRRRQSGPDRPRGLHHGGTRSTAKSRPGCSTYQRLGELDWRSAGCSRAARA